MSGTEAWQIITETTTEAMERIRVPGGWIYRNSVFASYKTISSSICFVPLPKDPTDAR